MPRGSNLLLLRCKKGGKFHSFGFQETVFTSRGVASGQYRTSASRWLPFDEFRSGRLASTRLVGVSFDVELKNQNSLQRNRSVGPDLLPAVARPPKRSVSTSLGLLIRAWIGKKPSRHADNLAKSQRSVETMPTGSIPRSWRSWSWGPASSPVIRDFGGATVRNRWSHRPRTRLYPLPSSREGPQPPYGL